MSWSQTVFFHRWNWQKKTLNFWVKILTILCIVMRKKFHLRKILIICYEIESFISSSSCRLLNLLFLSHYPQENSHFFFFWKLSMMLSWEDERTITMKFPFFSFFLNASQPHPSRKFSWEEKFQKKIKNQPK